MYIYIYIQLKTPCACLRTLHFLYLRGGCFGSGDPGTPVHGPTWDAWTRGYLQDEMNEIHTFCVFYRKNCY